MPIELTIDEQLKSFRAEIQAGMDKCDLPPHCRVGLMEYLVEGRPMGDFLTAMICNDFMEAAIRADDYNQRALHNYAKFLYNYAPMGSVRGKENMDRWQEQGGLRGMLANAVASE